MENERPYQVYMHTCPNGKKYIGASKLGFKKRWQANKYVHCSFREACKEFGWENIEHAILFDNLTFDQAKELEQAMIRAYNTFNPKFGYNCDKAPLYRPGSKPRPVKCLETGEVFPSITQAGIQMNLDARHILLVCKKKGRKHVGGYSFCYADEEGSND